MESVHANCHTFLMSEAKVLAVNRPAVNCKGKRPSPSELTREMFTPSQQDAHSRNNRST